MNSNYHLYQNNPNLSINTNDNSVNV